MSLVRSIFCFISFCGLILASCVPLKIIGQGFIANYYKYPDLSTAGWGNGFFVGGYKSLGGQFATQEGVKLINFWETIPTQKVIYGDIYGQNITISNYTIELTGYFYAKLSGKYTFTVVSDDGATLQLDDGLYCCNDVGSALGNSHFQINSLRGYAGMPAANPSSYTTTLLGDRYYPIKIITFNWDGPYGLKAYYVDPNGQKQDFDNVVQAQFDSEVCPLSTSTVTGPATGLTTVTTSSTTYAVTTVTPTSSVELSTSTVTGSHTGLTTVTESSTTYAVTTVTPTSSVELSTSTVTGSHTGLTTVTESSTTYAVTTVTPTSSAELSTSTVTGPETGLTTVTESSTTYVVTTTTLSSSAELSTSTVTGPSTGLTTVTESSTTYVVTTTTSASSVELSTSTVTGSHTGLTTVTQSSTTYVVTTATIAVSGELSTSTVTGSHTGLTTITESSTTYVQTTVTPEGSLELSSTSVTGSVTGVSNITESNTSYAETSLIAGGTKTETHVQSTIVTITSCSDHKCHETTVPATWGPVTSILKGGVVTVYTTWCPESGIEKGGLTTTSTVTSCSDNECHEVIAPATWGPTTTTLQGGEVTVYTTWCPITESTSTTIYKTVVCTEDVCKTSIVTGVVIPTQSIENVVTSSEPPKAATTAAVESPKSAGYEPSSIVPEYYPSSSSLTNSVVGTNGTTISQYPNAANKFGSSVLSIASLVLILLV